MDCHSIFDLKKRARKKLPSVMFDYIEGGSEDEQTLQWNRDAYAKYEFKPRILNNVSEIDLRTTVQGIDIDIPVLSAPTAMSRTFHYEGERAVARATHKAGSIYSLSTVATCSIEEIATIAREATDFRSTKKGPLFFQIYAWHNRDMVKDFIKRCKDQGYEGLMLAVDMPVLGKRERDLRNGHGRPRILRKNTALAALKRPAWLYHFITKPSWKMANMIEHLPYGASALKTVDTVNQQFSAAVDWDEAKRLRDEWDGPFILKGIQSADDALKAAEAGASGIILSNHGGRQLDGAPATLDLLPEVIQAVGSHTSTEVMIDGGIMRGADIIKAIALGAKATFIGRAYLYGLAAEGEKGVTKAYDILREEMIRVMQLIGCRSLSELSPDCLKRRD